MKTVIRLILCICLVLLAAASSGPATVSADSVGILYTVQNGDTLDLIAKAFHTTTARIMLINYFADPNELYPGRRVIIPGFDDIQGEVIRVNLPYGQSLTAYLDSTGQPAEVLERLNFITSYDQTYAGQAFYIMKTDLPTVQDVPVFAGMTSLELAVKQNISPWTAAECNNLRGTWALLPNDTVYLPDNTGVEGVTIETTADQTLTSTTLLQGKTAELIAAALPEGSTLSGSLSLPVNDSLGTSTQYTETVFPLHFFAEDDGRLTALQGIHRFAKPGFASMVITTTYADGTSFSYEQNLLVNSYNYGTGAPIIVDESFIDPSVTVPEWEMIKTYIQTAPSEKQWTYGFISPSPTPETWISAYGLLRSYNESDLIYFHSGIDYPGSYSTPIFAAAAGEVVFAGDLDVRGGATIISHGRGVYTGYWHQSQINVQVGEHVEAGQTIGMVGDKGRVTGAHLHFEVLVGGVQVDPLEWLQGMY